MRIDRTSDRKLVELRMATYKPPVPPKKRCQTCGYSSEYHIFGRTAVNCSVVGKNEFFTPVHDEGVCDLWKAKDQPCPK